MREKRAAMCVGDHGFICVYFLSEGERVESERERDRERVRVREREQRLVSGFRVILLNGFLVVCIVGCVSMFCVSV